MDKLVISVYVYMKYTYSAPSKDIISPTGCFGEELVPVQIQASKPQSLEQKHIMSIATRIMNRPMTPMITR